MPVESLRETTHRLFVLSVDDLEWTKEWLGDLRCDTLLVWLSSSPAAKPRILIRAVESKASTSTTPIPTSPSRDPFGHGLDQVVATLGALSRVVESTGRHPLIEDLRFASFVEHLASVVLRDLHPIRSGDDEAATIITTLNDFSGRRLGSEDVVLDGMVVCTQYQTAARMEASSLEAGLDGDGGPWRVTLVRCGTDEVTAVLGEGLSAALTSSLTSVLVVEAEVATGDRDVEGGRGGDPHEPAETPEVGERDTDSDSRSTGQLDREVG